MSTMTWLAIGLVLVALALVGALWRMWRRLLIRPGDVVSINGVQRRIVAVHPLDCTITMDEPFDAGSGDAWEVDP